MFTRLITTVGILLFCARAGAAVVEYENEQRPDFFAAIGGIENATAIGFTEFPNNTTLTDQYSNLGVTFEGLNFVTGPSGSFSDSWGLRIFNGNDLFFDEPINWIAADLIGKMQIELYSGDELFYTSTPLGIGGLGEFGGLISDQPFDRVRIFAPSDPLAVLDNLFFGPMIAVPAPGALAALLGGLCILRKRRR